MLPISFLSSLANSHIAIKLSFIQKAADRTKKKKKLKAHHLIRHLSYILMLFMFLKIKLFGWNQKIFLHFLITTFLKKKTDLKKVYFRKFSYYY